MTIIDVDGMPLTPADLTPEVAAPEYDAAHIVARRDSFQITMQGNVLGYQLIELAVTADSLLYDPTVSIPMAGIGMNTVLRIDPTTLLPTSYDANGMMMGQNIESHLVYTDGRVSGTVQSPSPTGTVGTTEVDTTIAEGVSDMTTLQALLPALPLEAGASLDYLVFDDSDASTSTVNLRVSGPEEVTVPAGTFSAFRIDLTGGEAAFVIYVSVTAPRKTIKMELVGQPLVFELVEGR